MTTSGENGLNSSVVTFRCIIPQQIELFVKVQCLRGLGLLPTDLKFYYLVVKSVPQNIQTPSGDATTVGTDAPGICA